MLERRADNSQLEGLLLITALRFLLSDSLRARRRRDFLGLIFLILGSGIGDSGHRGGSKSRLQHGAAWGRGHGHSAISNAAPARLGDRIWPCERLPPVGKEVIDPVGLTLFVQAIYKAFTERGITFMTSQARMLTPGSPSERRRNTSNVITAGD